MASEKLKEWVKKKREEGVSDERIRKSLKNTGHDPSIVDEIENPFDDEEVEPNQDVFEGENSEDSEARSDQESSDSNEKEENNQEELETEADLMGDTEIDDQESSRAAGVKSYFSSFASEFTVARLLVLLLVIVLMAGGYTVMSSDGPGQLNLPEIDSSNSDSDGLDVSGAVSSDSGQSCPDVGVRIDSLSASEGTTTADILVANGRAEVVLEIRENGETADYTTSVEEGESSISIDAVGDVAVLSPVGCKDIESKRAY